MRNLVLADADVMRLAIQQEIARSDESRYDHRLHGLLLVTGGHSCQQVADVLGEDRRTVQRGVTRFEAHGLTGVRDGGRSGRPATLNAKPWVALGRDLRRDPQTFGHAGHLWEGKLLAAHLRLRYKVRLGVRQCQRIFGHMGFRLRKPRPQVAQSDPVKVAACKNTAPPGPAPGRCTLERGRMPLPTTWHPVSPVGTARDQGSDPAPCAHPQVGRLCWCRQFAHRHIHPLSVRHVQCGHIRDRSEDAAAAARPRHAHGAGGGHCPVPPRGVAQTVASNISRRAHPAVSAAVQSAAGPRRARLEAGPPRGDAQPVLRHLGRSAHCRLNVLRPLEKAQLGAAEIMRHKLRRYV
jgi:transposase